MTDQPRESQKTWDSFMRTVAGHGPVRDAMASLDRMNFVGDQYSHLDAYTDRGLKIMRADGAHMTSLSQPSLIHRLVELLNPLAGERVLEIGTGTGYTAAVLGRLWNEPNNVVSVENDREAAQFARENLAKLGMSDITVIEGDGCDELPTLGPFHRILVTGATMEICRGWINQLVPGGRCIAPLLLVPGGQCSRLVVVVKGREAAYCRFVRWGMVGFMSMVGSHQSVSEPPHIARSDARDLASSARATLEGMTQSSMVEEIDALDLLAQALLGHTSGHMISTDDVDAAGEAQDTAEFIAAVRRAWTKLGCPHISDHMMLFGGVAGESCMSFSRHCGAMYLFMLGDVASNILSSLHDARSRLE